MRGYFSSAEADDAALLTQGKEAGADRRKIDRKDEQVFELNHYNIRECTEEDLIKYGIDLDEYYAQQNISTFSANNLESELRDAAENMIPVIEAADAYAKQKMNENEGVLTSSDSSSLAVTRAALWYSKYITYAEALLEATGGTDQYGNKVWSSVSNRAGYSNFKDPNSFLVDPATLSGSLIDGRRTATWSGTGDYCKYINGSLYYVSSGTQYTEFFAPNLT